MKTAVSAVMNTIMRTTRMFSITLILNMRLHHPLPLLKRRRGKEEAVFRDTPFPVCDRDSGWRIRIKKSRSALAGNLSAVFREYHHDPGVELPSRHPLHLLHGHLRGEPLPVRPVAGHRVEEVRNRHYPRPYRYFLH